MMLDKEELHNPGLGLQKLFLAKSARNADILLFNKNMAMSDGWHFPEENSDTHGCLFIVAFVIFFILIQILN